MISGIGKKNQRYKIFEGNGRYRSVWLDAGIIAKPAT